MLRYKHLLDRALDPENPHCLSLRELAEKFGFPVTTLYSYHKLKAIPRPDNMEKMARHFPGETVSSLYSEDDDDTARLIAAVRRLNDDQKQALLETVLKTLNKTTRHTPTHTPKTKTATQHES
jgi:hypothetical protein